MSLRDRLDADIGHDVGWDVHDCPTCGPIPPGDEDDHLDCDLPADDARGWPEMDGYLATATSGVSERRESEWLLGGRSGSELRAEARRLL